MIVTEKPGFMDNCPGTGAVTIQNRNDFIT